MNRHISSSCERHCITLIFFVDTAENVPSKVASSNAKQLLAVFDSNLPETKRVQEGQVGLGRGESADLCEKGSEV